MFAASFPLVFFLRTSDNHSPFINVVLFLLILFNLFLLTFGVFLPSLSVSL